MLQTKLVRRAEHLHPQPELLAAVVAASERIEPDVPELDEWHATYVKGHAPRIAHDVACVERWTKRGDLILDVGAVPLLLMATLHRRGHAVEGLDLRPDRFGRSIDAMGLKVRACDVETQSLPYDDCSVDVVVFNEIFEHLRINPIATFVQLRRVLKSDGLLIMSTPNGLSLKRLTSLWLRGRPGPPIHDEYAKLARLGHMGHVREYSINEGLDFLRALAFVPLEVIYRGCFATPEGRPALRLADAVGLVAPRLRPYYTLIARKAHQS